ncbi:outer membrane beta-barrel protein [Pseudohalioglobus sediminis]|uniref:Outer membrane beta-barrel protein n=1 Tax=Pseudohalioglobus sediminis TaxID=2606449 RepID=A0A5B0WTM1_9GAMM|nr:outer membrane beta-barrel protein [Pseudohalioglobus sediminis]KAA1189531.1 outer membrane beta-barrel protein [Pseudohalioglobus sediminis]
MNPVIPAPAVIRHCGIREQRAGRATAYSLPPIVGVTSIKFAVPVLAALLLATPALAREEPKPLMQAFLGSLKLDDQTASWDDVSDEDVDVEFPSSLPSGGIEAEYRYGGNDAFGWGINSGGSIGWKNSDTRISGGFSGDTGGVIRFDFDNSLFIGELHLGGYARAHLGPRVSVYAAAGPMIMYGRHKVEEEDVAAPTAEREVEISTSEESSFAFGYYSRAGIDFQYSPGQHLGLGVRYMAAKMDFDDTVGTLDLRGPQFVFTYSAQL